ncbi:hypothetical protein BATDEDRAFT_85552 [Batrachochytrium dendrobatidis JAM81]|uniref:Uncharacterized protein n=1 Tax=Batrachochytrium dendrobatidis (strain JAM81 / FGSC 10211) TaxID=684364 RepID=F4NT69_BATDJ|nr:uncharacterized protein BATDEDRAFT_85552 [Batrachochytrium dendrobatidis JAM81]EGF83893.1 hypothetical protein BATDEDRAFT_85552 [Batrachochytrium dendrobatidis JAM81]|eukprot:XP_006676267.1 hypothetical protein BATDEDRAFT_85552 [Batrachochytrium dendrobatidis JAM81]
MSCINAQATDRHIDDYPQLYREAVNHPEKVAVECLENKLCPPSAPNPPNHQHTPHPTPDLYPAVLRQVENLGIPRQN